MSLARRLRKQALSTAGGGITDPNHPDLAAFYTMDNISGSTLVDESGNFDGLLSSITTTTGIIGDAIYYSGNSASRVILDGVLPSTGLIEFSMSCWVKLRDVPGDDRAFILSHRSNTTQIINVYVDSGELHIDLRDSTSLLVRRDMYDMPINTWAHVVFNFDYNNDLYTAWVNGVQVFTITDNFTGNFNSSKTTVGPGWNGSSYDYFAGGPTEFDQYRLFNRVLTSDEIADLYNGGAGA